MGGVNRSIEKGCNNMNSEMFRVSNLGSQGSGFGPGEGTWRDLEGVGSNRTKMLPHISFITCYPHSASLSTGHRAPRYHLPKMEYGGRRAVPPPYQYWQ
eukprot:3108758-Rhodomonas_salina.1